MSIFRSARGSGLTTLLLSGSLLLAFSFFIVKKRSDSIKQNQASLASSGEVLALNTIIETMLLAYQQAEVLYYKELAASCTSGNPFLLAMKEGSGCDTTISVFTGTDQGTQNALYTYPGSGCEIKKDSSTCSASQNQHLLTLVPNLPRFPYSGDFYLLAVRPKKQIVEFMLKAKQVDASGATIANYSRSFAIKASMEKTAHLEFDGRVIQSHSDPLSDCPTQPWAEAKIYNAAATQPCQSFVKLGSGIGLIYYQNRYFGYRPHDAQIVDLEALTTSSTYLVKEDGTLDGVKVFPRYKKSEMQNIDEVTTIDDTLYFISGSGASAAMSYLDPQSLTRKTLCNLGSLGWGRAYSGLAAFPWSDDVAKDNSTSTTSKNASFFLKSSGGELLTLIVSKETDNTITCFVTLDPNAQEVEFFRTYGFDRAAPSKRYYLY